jgi:hypothetical protein
LIALELDILKDAEALGISFAQTPAVLLDGQVVMNGLPRTEEIEAVSRHARIAAAGTRRGPASSHRFATCGRYIRLVALLNGI